MLEFIQDWVKQVNQRTDLLPTWRERTLNVILLVGSLKVYLYIDQSGVHLKTDKQDNEHNDIRLQSSSSIMKTLFAGEQKLTSLPQTTIKVQGAYRNILFIESLLLLAR
ncbi:hypothetical protein CEH05_14545 [Halobacillus halophilus]|uniref:hypothetical protein n=1 Tax=Halobacillus halophilus TaxID=1570 RepID=UPI0003152AFD|nr:hypothetical protein [Halobacillus halophilus]ASF40296.1 hypothetical protein CEH05_14545 [Halobacillus halophilus]